MKWFKESRLQNIPQTKPRRDYFEQKQKNNITKFWPTGFFKSIIFCFLIKKNKKQNTTNLNKQPKPRSTYCYYNKL